jgi:hypothetical protein
MRRARAEEEEISAGSSIPDTSAISTTELLQVARRARQPASTSLVRASSKVQS